MMRRMLPLTAVLALALAAHLGAGGWAVITVDTLPESAVAAAPTPLSFTVRQHGQTLMDDLQPRVHATDGQDQISSNAKPSGQKGQYTATITFPRSAAWTVTIDSGFMASRLTLLPLPVVADIRHAPAPLTPVGRGLRLFVAKGCGTCHQNGLESGNTSLGFAPALVAGKHQDGFLASILLKPEAVLSRSAQPVGAMPNLNLQPEEVTALVAFINNVATAVVSR
jgi:mono/diheme cytochrome c family protein